MSGLGKGTKLPYSRLSLPPKPSLALQVWVPLTTTTQLQNNFGVGGWVPLYVQRKVGLQGVDWQCSREPLTGVHPALLTNTHALEGHPWLVSEARGALP